MSACSFGLPFEQVSGRELAELVFPNSLKSLGFFRSSFGVVWGSRSKPGTRFRKFPHKGSTLKSSHKDAGSPRFHIQVPLLKVPRFHITAQVSQGSTLRFQFRFHIKVPLLKVQVPQKGSTLKSSVSPRFHTHRGAGSPRFHIQVPRFHSYTLTSSQVPQIKVTRFQRKVEGSRSST